MVDTFESLGIVPWIVQQTAKLGKLEVEQMFLNFYFIVNYRFLSERIEETNAYSKELYPTNFVGFGLYWCCQNWVIPCISNVKSFFFQKCCENIFFLHLDRGKLSRLHCLFYKNSVKSQHIILH